MPPWQKFLATAMMFTVMSAIQHLYILYECSLIVVISGWWLSSIVIYKKVFWTCRPLVSFLEKAKAGAQQVTEKVTEAVSKLTTTDSNDQNQQTTTTETSNSKSKSESKIAEVPKGDAQESSTLQGQSEKTETEPATSKKAWRGGREIIRGK